MNVTKAAFAGIDVGGTNVSAAIADAQGQVLGELKRPTRSHEGPLAVLERIAEMVGALSEQAGVRPAALGIGVPGLVDVTAGVTKFLPNMPTQWREVPVRDILEPKVACPVYILNDARAATLGELAFGHGQNARTMVFFGLGTGVGGGVIVDGQLRLGPMGAAGELGHQTVWADGPLCGCGNRGCLETLVSGPALSAEGVRLVLSGNAPKLYEISGGDLRNVSPITMSAAAQAGEATVLAAIERAAEWLGIGAANLATALHPDLIVIGGGVSAMGDLLLKPLRQTLQRRVRMFPADTIRVERSVLGDRAGLLGGIALAQRGGVKPL